MMLSKTYYIMASDNKPKSDRSQQHLANERTFLSWVRTSIALIGLGFIISKFSFFLTEFRLIIQRYPLGSTGLPIDKSNFTVDQISNWIGLGAVMLAILIILFALKNYRDTHKSIETQTYVSNHNIVYATTIIIVILSAIVFIYLMQIPNR